MKALLRAAGQDSVERGPVQCVVLDFDGTLTDADLHAASFQQASRDQLALRLGLGASQMQVEWHRADAALHSSPESLGWEVEGWEVCPARADPYLIANSITESLLKQYDIGDGAEGRRAIVSQVHREAYLRVLPTFRKEARAVLERLLDLDLAVCVVTNSHTDTVSALLDSLSVRGRDKLRVRGGASKFSVCGPTVPSRRFDALPDKVTLAPVQREIYVRRGMYFNLLQELWEDTSSSPETTLVAGDIFELDLAMPAMLGAHVHLVTRAGTLQSELAAVELLRRGAYGPLGAVIDRL
ncbi:MAG: HAD family hydrolase [Deltaproteobacteria bacterium]|nr:HAD family hydrolase [Deltaproteobacteria bacterium]